MNKDNKRKEIKSIINDKNIKRKKKKFKNLLHYMEELTNKKLNIKQIPASEEFDQFERAQTMKKLTREKTYKKNNKIQKKHTAESKKFVPSFVDENEKENDEMKHLLAKMKNDQDFKDLEVNEITPEVMKNFVAKQFLIYYNLLKETKVIEETFKDKK